MTLVLVTGFGPFPGAPQNPSESVLRRMSARSADASLVLQVLPTEYRAAGPLLDRLIAQLEPDLCLCTGVGKGPGVRIERLARNDGTIADLDNAGQGWAGPIAPGGPPVYEAGLPLERIVCELAQRGHAAAISDDAGGYLCNFVFYRASHLVAERGMRTRCGFLHLPALSSGDEERSVERLVDVVRACIDASLGGLPLAKSLPA